MRVSGTKYFFAVLTLIFLTWTSPVLSQSTRDLYNRGVQMVQNHRYEDAIEFFRGRLAADQTSHYADNYQYWIGECYFRLGDFRRSIVEFDKVFTFPRNNKGEDSFLRIAQCHEELGETRLALDLYQRFIAEFPECNERNLNRVMEKIAELSGS